MDVEPVAVLAGLARAFDAIGIRYGVGGSFASSIHGIPRSTHGVGLLAEVRASHVEALTRLMTGEF
jgi:hypothetical protein